MQEGSNSKRMFLKLEATSPVYSKTGLVHNAMFGLKDKMKATSIVVAYICHSDYSLLYSSAVGLLKASEHRTPS